MRKSKTRNIALWFIDKSKVLFIFSLLIPVILFPFIQDIEKDFSHKAFYKDNDPFLAKYLDYEKAFGNDDKVVVIATHKDSFLEDKETLTKIHKQLEKVKDSVSVQSLYNYPHIKEVNDEIIISNYLAEDNEDILNNKKLTSFLISKDGRVASFFISLKNYHQSEANYSIPVDSAKKLTKSLKLEDVKFAFTGTAALMDAVKKYTVFDLKLLLPLVLLIITVVSYLLFQNIIVCILSVLLTILTIVTTLGLGYFLGIKLSSTTALIPQILLSICILDAIHILSFFSLKSTKEGLGKDTLIETLQVNLVPTLLTSITTSLGFFSLCFSDLKPVQDLGTLCSLGVMIAWFISYFFLPFAMIKLGSKFKQFNQGLTKIHSQSFVEYINRHKRKILIISTAIFIISLDIAADNEVDADTLNFFKKDAKVRLDYEYALENIGGVKGIELLLSDKKNVLTPSNLRKLEQLEKELIKIDYITNVKTIRDELQSIYQLIMPNSSKSLHDLSIGEIKEVLFTYELSAGPDNSPWKWVTNDLKKLKVNILWTLSGNKNSLQAIKKIKKIAKKIGLKLAVTGKTSLVVGVNDYLVKTILSSISLAIIFLTLLMGFFTKSLRVGIATMIPNIFPIIIVAAITKLYGIPIHMGSVLVASICLGIAIDDTIHFCYHYYQLKKDGVKNEVENITEILDTTGKSLISTTLILVSCFILFIFSKVTINIEFGILTTLVLILALLCDFIILPAIILNKKST
jgi:predicted RND superfamily exporter protein